MTEYEEYLEHLKMLEKSPDILVRLRGYSELADEYYWKEGLLEAITEIERLRAAPEGRGR